MRLGKKEEDILKLICKEYANVKDLVMRAETLDKKSGANLQIYKEFRDALSHIMKVFGDILQSGKQGKKDKNWYVANLDKARGHIYRAGYDAMDGVAISLKETMNTLDGVNINIKTQIVSGYIDKIKSLENLHEMLSSYRQNKVIGSNATSAFHECMRKLDNVTTDIKIIHNAMPFIQEMNMKERKGVRFSIWLMIVGLFGSAIVGAILTIIISKFYSTAS